MENSIMKSIYINFINILYTYFTPAPYFLYNQATRCSNLAFAGIGLGLIQSQQIFWISNLCMLIILIYKDNVRFYYFNIILLSICIFLYTLSISKTFSLIKYLHKN